LEEDLTDLFKQQNEKNIGIVKAKRAALSQSMNNQESTEQKHQKIGGRKNAFKTEISKLKHAPIERRSSRNHSFADVKKSRLRRDSSNNLKLSSKDHQGVFEQALKRKAQDLDTPTASGLGGQKEGVLYNIEETQNRPALDPL